MEAVKTKKNKILKVSVILFALFVGATWITASKIHFFHDANLVIGTNGQGNISVQDVNASGVVNVSTGGIDLGGVYRTTWVSNTTGQMQKAVAGNLTAILTNVSDLHDMINNSINANLSDLNARVEASGTNTTADMQKAVATNITDVKTQIANLNTTFTANISEFNNWFDLLNFTTNVSDNHQVIVGNQVNISILWTNISWLNQNVTALWTNASDFNQRINDITVGSGNDYLRVNAGGNIISANYSSGREHFNATDYYTHRQVKIYNEVDDSKSVNISVDSNGDVHWW